VPSWNWASRYGVPHPAKDSWLFLLDRQEGRQAILNDRVEMYGVLGVASLAA